MPRSQDDLAPSGARARAAANIAALRVLRTLQAQGRGATGPEQALLARWSAWGAIPQVFDERDAQWGSERAQVRELLSEAEFVAARRTTINAHYTDPVYVRAIWAGLGQLGFTGGRVLEPGCGAGTFIGMAPGSARMTGVELDPTSAAIAAALYPGAQVLAESFAQTRRPGGYFDAVVGNVPFADVVLHDQVHNRGGHSMHNHFIIKSLALTRPGGLIAVLTSRFTMDSTNPAARREINAMADLVGAVRLPTGAHRRAAGTEVVTDLLVLRRREEGRTPRDTVWETVGAHLVDGHKVRTNNYFIDHPGQVLGQYTAAPGQFGEATLSVRADLEQLPARLTAAVGTVVEDGTTAGLTWTERPAPTEAEPPAPVAIATSDQWEAHLTAHPDGTFTAVEDGVHVPIQVPSTRAGELRALLDLRDQARSLLTAEASSLEDTDDLAAGRDRLRSTYETYVDRYGPLNRVSHRPTGRANQDTGEPIMARVRPPVMRHFRSDPFSALVMALEIFDESTGTASPAELLSRRVVVPRRRVLGADTAEEALTLCIEATGGADLEHVAELLGTDRDEAREQLGELVFDDPADPERIVPAAEYLSGNVVVKLDRAREAAAEDPRFAVNVRRLQEVIPTPLRADEVAAQLGAVWIPAEIHERFLNEVLQDRNARVIHGGGALWDVKTRPYGPLATHEWGTDRMPAGEIVQHLMTQTPIRITDKVDDKRVFNATATEAAQEKAVALSDRFAEWVWEDPGRTELLLDRYNRQFNALVLRDYTEEGRRLTLPGLVSTFTPREHQRTAVARMIHEPAVGLFHEVGAGKTAEMAMGVMELRRLGLVTKPVVNVPNHMLEQFTREWLQLYPQARLLAASGEDLAGDGRRRFVARAATGDWDAIVMTRGAFERIPVSRQAEADYLTQELSSIREALVALGDDPAARQTVKRLEKKIAGIEERAKARLDGPEDPGITFEQTGIDYVVVDEMHDFKNLMTVSAIPDAQITGSKRATDLHMKLELLRSRHGARVVTGATATPIANSITEAHVMQRYMRPDLLADAGVGSFDAWAATFGRTVTEIEMTVTGGYKSKTRFAKFQNVPEMLRSWHVFADVRTAADLDLDRPELTMDEQGRRLPRTMLIEPDPGLLEHMQWLGQRADQVSRGGIDPSIDNMLTITSDGRKAALDLRLAGRPAAIRSKVDAAADTIAQIYTEHRGDRFRDAVTGEPSPVPGALQFVFCDLSTPGPGWSVYEELRGQLVRRGVPRGQVRFIHEARNDAEKAALFAAARSGHISVLVGSTQKMGTGTNAQARAIALHHLDCPWRPADLEQRDGRALRQGNQNPEISIYRWVTERSFDAYSWQTVERKAKFIGQVMRGKLDVREIDDIGDSTLSLGEVKALASGNPLILAREQAQQQVTKLERLERAWHRGQGHLALTRTVATGALAKAERELIPLQRAAAQVPDLSGEHFALDVGGSQVTRRTDAADLLRAWTHRVATTAVAAGREDHALGEVCRVGELTVTAVALARASHDGPRPPRVKFQIDGVPRSQWTMTIEEAAAPGIGAVTRIENAVARIPATAALVDSEAADARRTLDQVTHAEGAPFKHGEDLKAARAELKRIDEQMAEQADEQPEQPTGQPQGPSLADRIAALRDQHQEPHRPEIHDHQRVMTHAL